MPDGSSVTPVTGNGDSPFDQIRRLDAFGREYWTGRDLQPLMEYSRWEDFASVIAKAKSSLALVHGDDQAGHHFREEPEVIQGGRWGTQTVNSFRLSRFAAYLTAMAGDDQKQAVAEARIYFAVRTREAELGAITEAEKRDTALARARPAGQMSWHLSPADLDLFPESLAPRVHPEDPRAKWDGHDTPTKYERLVELTARTHYERHMHKRG